MHEDWRFKSSSFAFSLPQIQSVSEDEMKEEIGATGEPHSTPTYLGN